LITFRRNIRDAVKHDADHCEEEEELENKIGLH
jgi:hypothetical protein